jgi:hypothetical protein
LVGGVAGVVKKGANKSVQAIRGMFKKTDAETQALDPEIQALIDSIDGMSEDDFAAAVNRNKTPSLPKSEPAPSTTISDGGYDLESPSSELKQILRPFTGPPRREPTPLNNSIVASDSNAKPEISSSSTSATPAPISSNKQAQIQSLESGVTGLTTQATPPNNKVQAQILELPSLTKVPIKAAEKIPVNKQSQVRSLESGVTGLTTQATLPKNKGQAQTPQVKAKTAAEVKRVAKPNVNTRISPMVSPEIGDVLDGPSLLEKIGSQRIDDPVSKPITRKAQVRVKSPELGVPNNKNTEDTPAQLFPLPTQAVAKTAATNNSKPTDPDVGKSVRVAIQESKLRLEKDKAQGKKIDTIKYDGLTIRDVDFDRINAIEIREAKIDQQMSLERASINNADRGTRNAEAIAAGKNRPESTITPPTNTTDPGLTTITRKAEVKGLELGVSNNKNTEENPAQMFSLPPSGPTTAVPATAPAPSSIDDFKTGRLRFMTGGMVYASGGQHINFEPKGTDTIPAMLTPGEFVVNRAATQKNLSLLKDINNGAAGYSSGGVVYLGKGGLAKMSDADSVPKMNWDTMPNNEFYAKIEEVGKSLSRGLEPGDDKRKITLSNMKEHLSSLVTGYDEAIKRYNEIATDKGSPLFSGDTGQVLVDDRGLLTANTTVDQDIDDVDKLLKNLLWLEPLDTVLGTPRSDVNKAKAEAEAKAAEEAAKAKAVGVAPPVGGPPVVPPVGGPPVVPPVGGPPVVPPVGAPAAVAAAVTAGATAVAPVVAAAVAAAPAAGAPAAGAPVAAPVAPPAAPPIPVDYYDDLSFKEFIDRMVSQDHSPVAPIKSRFITPRFHVGRSQKEATELAKKTGEAEKPVVQQKTYDAFNTRVLGEKEEDPNLSVVAQDKINAEKQAKIESQATANEKSGGKDVIKGSDVRDRMTDDENDAVRGMTGVTSQYKSAYSYFRSRLGEYNYKHILEGRRKAYNDDKIARRTEYDNRKVKKVSQGGLIYLSGGGDINFQPQGTDTVPAMLTPGEFVVNQKSAKQNMGLLQSINQNSSLPKSYYSRGGGVGYYSAGGEGQSSSGSMSIDFSSFTKGVGLFSSAVEKLGTYSEKIASIDFSSFSEGAKTLNSSINILSSSIGALSGSANLFNSAATLFGANIGSITTAINALSKIPTTITLTGRIDMPNNITVTLEGNTQDATGPQMKKDILLAVANALRGSNPGFDVSGLENSAK